MYRVGLYTGNIYQQTDLNLINECCYTFNTLEEAAEFARSHMISNCPQYEYCRYICKGCPRVLEEMEDKK